MDIYGSSGFLEDSNKLKMGTVGFRAMADTMVWSAEAELAFKSVIGVTGGQIDITAYPSSQI